MEPLGGVASVIAVVQLAESVVGLCSKYASGVRNAKKDIERLKGEVNAVVGVLKEVDTVLKRQGSAADVLKEPIAQCEAALAALKAHLDPVQRPQSSNWAPTVRAFADRAKLRMRLLKWPFESGDVEKHVAILERCKSTITTALGAINLGLSMDIRAGVGEIQADVDGIQTGIGGIQTNIENINTGVGGIQTNVENIQTGVGDIQTGVGTIQAGVGEIQADIGESLVLGKGVQEGVENIQTGVGEIKTGVGEIQTVVDESVVLGRGIQAGIDVSYMHINTSDTFWDANAHI